MNTQLSKKTIVLPEGDDERVIQAAEQLRAQDICDVIVVGTDVPVDNQFQSVLHQGAALLNDGTADGMVAGAVHTTADLARVAIKEVGMAKEGARLSSCFLMKRDDEQLVFADCAISPTPTIDELVATATEAAAFASSVGIEPRVAFISFATGASVKSELVETVHEAAKAFKAAHPEIVSAGPIQYDVARSPKKAADKGVTAPIVGDATVLVFKDLDVANPLYKAVEIEGGYQAIGPLLLGAAKPVNDLSRGCSVEDIVEVARITAMQCI